MAPLRPLPCTAICSALLEYFARASRGTVRMFKIETGVLLGPASPCSCTCPCLVHLLPHYWLMQRLPCTDDAAQACVFGFCCSSSDGCLVAPCCCCRQVPATRCLTSTLVVGSRAASGTCSTGWTHARSAHRKGGPHMKGRGPEPYGGGGVQSCPSVSLERCCASTTACCCYC